MGYTRLLFLTYIFSFLLTSVLECSYLLLLHGISDDTRVYYIVIAGSCFLNFMLIFTAGPGIFISSLYPNDKPRAFIACFFTPLIILIIILSGLLKLQKGDFEMYLITIMSFSLILGYFFFKNLTPNNVQEANKVSN